MGLIILVSGGRILFTKILAMILYKVLHKLIGRNCFVDIGLSTFGIKE